MNINNSKKFLKSHKQAIILGLILFFAFILRIYSLGTSPLWIDEATSVDAGMQVLKTGFPISDSGMSHGAYFLHYSIALFLAIAQTEFFARIVSVIFGLLTIFLAYKVGKEYSNSTALISALLFSVFYLEIFFSRQARYYQLLQLAFFASLYFLYKSKENKTYLIPSILCFFIALDTHLQAIVLAPFLILHILVYNRKQSWATIFPLIPLIRRIFSVPNLSSQSIETTTNYATRYLFNFRNSFFILILAIPGIIIGFIKKQRLSFLLFVPTLFVLLGTFSLKTYALRYSYLAVFPTLIFVAVLFGFLYDKYGKQMLFPLFLIILIPSNIFFPYNFTTILIPGDYQLRDSSTPSTDYKNLPEELKQEMINSKLISYFPSDVEFYLKRPDYVIPFNFNGLSPDQSSMNNSQGILVDRYSGALILQEIPEKPYLLTADRFSVSKLFPEQRQSFKELTEDCEKVYSNFDLEIWKC
jgi:hypothetical protein